MLRDEYINTIAPLIQKYCVINGVKVASPIIAQAIVEGLFYNDETNRSEESILAFQYHNYFGMMAFSDWTGKKVNLATWEEFDPGVRTDTVGCFRVYDTMEEGVKGYFDFIKYPRYANLFQTSDPYEYCQFLKDDGWATASQYVDVLKRVIQSENLTKYDDFSRVIVSDQKEVQSFYKDKCVFFDGKETRFSTEVYGDYKCSADILNVRDDAGTNNKIMISIFTGTKVMCSGFYREAEGMKWMLIQFYGLDGTVYCGWASADYLERI